LPSSGIRGQTYVDARNGVPPFARNVGGLLVLLAKGSPLGLVLALLLLRSTNLLGADIKILIFITFLGPLGVVGFARSGEVLRLGENRTFGRMKLFSAELDSNVIFSWSWLVSSFESSFMRDWLWEDFCIRI
jgi:hypothetical protein